MTPEKEQRTWLNPYNYCQNNPINRTDPTGALDGDSSEPGWYIDEKGVKLGCDGQSTNKYYLVTSERDKNMIFSLNARGQNTTYNQLKDDLFLMPTFEERIMFKEMCYDVSSKDQSREYGIFSVGKSEFINSSFEENSDLQFAYGISRGPKFIITQNVGVKGSVNILHAERMINTPNMENLRFLVHSHNYSTKEVFPNLFVNKIKKPSGPSNTIGKNQKLWTGDTMAISSKKTLGGIVFDTENETVWFYKSCQKSFGKMNIDVFSNLFQDEKY